MDSAIVPGDAAPNVTSSADNFIGDDVSGRIGRPGGIGSRGDVDDTASHGDGCHGSYRQM